MNFVHEALRPTVDPLADRTWVLLGLAAVPLPLTIALFVVHSVATGTPRSGYGLPMAYLVYGVANLVTVGVLYVVLTPAERNAVFRFERPSLREIGWAVVAFVVGLGVYQATSALNASLGFELQGLSYSLASPSTAAIVVVGAVVLAPLTEEVLYRGVVLGTLLSRGFGTVAAVGLMTLLFALLHLPNFGVAGTVFISVWGVLPAILRVRFDDLSGAVLMHALNNAFAYVVAVGLGWA